MDYKGYKENDMRYMKPEDFKVGVVFQQISTKIKFRVISTGTRINRCIVTDIDNSGYELEWQTNLNDSIKLWQIHDIKRVITS